jgi:hypothetical protein
MRDCDDCLSEDEYRALVLDRSGAVYSAVADLAAVAGWRHARAVTYGAMETVATTGSRSRGPTSAALSAPRWSRSALGRASCANSRTPAAGRPARQAPCSPLCVAVGSWRR